jgi:hypothetical protein
MYAYTPCHKFFEVVQPFMASGPAEVKCLVDMIAPLIVGTTKDPTDKRKQIFSECVHIAMVAMCCINLGREVGKEL